MKILIVSATKLEIQPLLNELTKSGALNSQWNEYVYRDHEINFLVSGIGSSLTSYALTRELKEGDYDLVLNVGIAGSFHRETKIGEVLAVKQDVFSDLGLESEEGFRSVFELDLIKPNDHPFKNGTLNVPIPNYMANSLRQLRQIVGITVNTITGQKKTVKSLILSYQPDIETMEGAAVFYVCLMEELAFAQIRAISNYVGERDKSKWDIPLATTNLAIEVISILNKL
ncbi:MAG: futalosine hydrolase [Bacteroidota bacterium]|nr:futalosine hydrolase [Bacteroidota bacterium]